MKFIIWILAGIFHIWTVIIAFGHGILAGILSLILPVLAEIYWVFNLWNENPSYRNLALATFVILPLVSILLFRKKA